MVGDAFDGYYLVATGICLLALEQYGRGSRNGVALAVDLDCGGIVEAILTLDDLFDGVSTLDAAQFWQGNGIVAHDGGPVPALGVLDIFAGRFYTQERCVD